MAIKWHCDGEGMTAMPFTGPCGWQEFVTVEDYDAVVAERDNLQRGFNAAVATVEARDAELTAIKRTREQEADYANTCYQNQQLKAELAGYKESHDKYCPSAERVRALEAAQGHCSIHGECPQCRADRIIGDPREIVSLGPTVAETPEAMHARIVTETADAIAAQAETPVSTLCGICDQIKELHPNTHPWTAKETALKPCWCNAGCMLKIRGKLPASRYCKQARSAKETFDVTKEPSIEMKNEMREISGLEPLKPETKGDAGG